MRGEGSDWSTAFLAFWVRDRKLWFLEEGDPSAHPGFRVLSSVSSPRVRSAPGIDWTIVNGVQILTGPSRHGLSPAPSACAAGAAHQRGAERSAR